MAEDRGFESMEEWVASKVEHVRPYESTYEQEFVALEEQFATLGLDELEYTADGKWRWVAGNNTGQVEERLSGEKSLTRKLSALFTQIPTVGNDVDISWWANTLRAIPRDNLVKFKITEKTIEITIVNPAEV